LTAAVGLRPATDADHNDIVALTNWAYRGTGPQSSWTVESYLDGERISAEALRADLAAAPEAHLLVWRDEGGERPFPYGDDRFGRPQRDDLAFVVLEGGLQGGG
jgi:hypothetical protein